jgi:hypothetical protein
VFFTDEDGVTHIVAAGPKVGEVKTADLGEVVLATPAIADGVLYFRTRDHVVAIRRSDAPAAEAAPTPDEPSGDDAGPS